MLPLNVWGGYIIAQKRDSQRDPGGFVFYRGHVSRNGRVFLGRAWGPYSRVIFQKTKFDIDVAPKGWMIGTRLGKFHDVASTYNSSYHDIIITLCLVLGEFEGKYEGKKKEKKKKVDIKKM